MAIRDLIPWSRQETHTPALYGEEQRSPVLRLRQEMDRLFDDFFSAPLLGGLTGRSLAWPRLEVSDTDDEVRVTAELPGLNEKDVEILVQDGVFTVRGEKKSETDDKERGWSERYYGRFERSLLLPDGADESKAEAEFHDGVLTVRMPKTEQATRARKIPINAGTRH
jgi:HSP20 family protein